MVLPNGIANTPEGGTKIEPQSIRYMVTLNKCLSVQNMELSITIIRDIHLFLIGSTGSYFYLYDESICIWS